MNKLITHSIFIISLLFTLMANAQNTLSVKSFREDSSCDIARKNPVKDGNQNDCALIIVTIRREDEDVQILDKIRIGKAIKENYNPITGEYMAYISTYMTKITIYTKEYDELNYKFEFDLKPNCTYRLEIELPLKNLGLEQFTRAGEQEQKLIARNYFTENKRLKDCALIEIKYKIPVNNPLISKSRKTFQHSETFSYYAFVPATIDTISIDCNGYNKLSFAADTLKPGVLYKMIIDLPKQLFDRQSKWSIDFNLTAGHAIGAELNFNVSYFLIGIGADYFITKTIGKTTKKTLFNSGYTGNFLREKTVSLNGTRTHLFTNVGAYFKYVSIACQMGVLFSQNTTTDLNYSGNGNGVQDEYVDQNWGNYAYYTLEKTLTDSNKKYFTIGPAIKGYIPFNRKYGITIGAGYSFIPGTAAGTAWGSAGIHVKFD